MTAERTETLWCLHMPGPSGPQDLFLGTWNQHCLKPSSSQEVPLGVELVLTDSCGLYYAESGQRGCRSLCPEGSKSQASFRSAPDTRSLEKTGQQQHRLASMDTLQLALSCVLFSSFSLLWPSFPSLPSSTLLLPSPLLSFCVSFPPSFFPFPSPPLSSLPSPHPSSFAPAALLSLLGWGSLS